MLIPKSKKTDPAKPGHRSLFATLFIPNIGADIRPLRQTTAVFVHLIAMLFAMNGLFPRDHPLLEYNSKVRMSLGEVINTAWLRVSFTKEKLPQTLFFFAVIGCMAITIIAVFVGALSLFMGKAHAQAAGQSAFFTAPGGNGAGSQDLAQQLLVYLFQGTPMNTLDENSSAGANSPLSAAGSATVIQCSLYAALGFYSDAILIVAAIVLFYHLAWMTVETAHHGQVMGKRGNQIWAPIRLVFAVGLLVPVGNANAGTQCAGGTGAGLNSGQYIVITIAEWGSGLASNVWRTFLNAISAEVYNYVAPGAPAVRKIVQNVVAMYACQYALNWYEDSDYPNPDTQATDTQWVPTAQQIEVCEPNPAAVNNNNDAPDCPANGPALPYVVPTQNPAGGNVQALANGNMTTTHFTFGNAYPGDMGICGSYTEFEAPVVNDTSYGGGSNTFEQTLITNVYNAQITAFEDLLANALTFVQQNIPFFIVGNAQYGPGDTGNTPYFLNGEDITLTYQRELDTGLGNAVLGEDDPNLQTLSQNFVNAGWVTAGAYFNRIARVQTALLEAATDGLPLTSPPTLAQHVATLQWYANNGDPDINSPLGANADANDYAQANVTLSSFEQWLSNTDVTSTAPVTGTAAQQSQAAAIEVDQSPESSCSSASDIAFNPTDCIFWLVDHVAAMNQAWHPAPTGGGGLENLLGIQFTGANPLAEVAAFGQANLSTAFKLADLGILLSAGGAAAEAHYPIDAQAASLLNSTVNAFGKLGQMAGSLCLTIAGIFFTIGFAMAFFVPLIPFISFFFGTLTWFAAVLEAVIAVPLVALAHLNPEGDGLPGQYAQQAYFYIFQVFLRPTLMIFGLLCGLLMFYVAVTLLNALFGIAVSGTGGLSHGHFTVARIIYTVIYVLLVIISANHSFVLITLLPDRALQWMGQGGLQGASMGDPGSLEGKMAGIQALITNQGMPQLGAGGRNAGGMLGRIGANQPGGGGGAAGGGGITKA